LVAVACFLPGRAMDLSASWYHSGVAQMEAKCHTILHLFKVELQYPQLTNKIFKTINFCLHIFL